MESTHNNENDLKEIKYEGLGNARSCQSASSYKVTIIEESKPD